MESQTEKNKAVVRKFNEDFLIAGNKETFESLVDPAFINYNMPTDQDTRTMTRDFILQLMHPALPDRKLTIHDMIAEGDKVFTFKTIEGTLAAPFMNADKPGSRFSMKIIDIIQLKDEKYIAHWSVREVATY
ncbi:SnoaL-like polyketide cyclase [Chitinophaga terrae (ex Kim and Jung 2007)]|jgi:predicted ester cyclase|uniref:SnoaL-like polyketide cyclase n=1 Tax=Chitinophaga terrae (ex Kim and Jung 2007) TaxID=408074 RepID=A0A1H4DFU9_9BACT|nr:ester cyclase [Chitinophaga terrae (ex Kim and Jung 2007)]MDQ0107703.1 putative ester cyclase [Chitinophaga terrae (ex Kim and Jung 2007)]GEP92681.1 hypothetical protein CTE07_43260 [Chitinophaga terrae (ex Kim and Jung 2007)]SEA71376.1 SnoaL-like polyketide cyclase [Chitinophaga terrae (ex Kim and Jung 2007)]